MFALHESRVGQKVLHSREALDVVDLVEDRQRQDLADAGDRSKAMIRLGIVLLRPSFEMELECAQTVAVDAQQLGPIDPWNRVGVGLGCRGAGGQRPGQS